MLSSRATSVFRTQASVGTFRRGIRYLSSEGKPSPPSSSSSSSSAKQFATFAVAGGVAYGLFFILKGQFQAASPVQVDNGPGKLNVIPLFAIIRSVAVGVCTGS